MVGHRIVYLKRLKTFANKLLLINLWDKEKQSGPGNSPWHEVR
jgi:hypothetical protein